MTIISKNLEWLHVSLVFLITFVMFGCASTTGPPNSQNSFQGGRQFYPEGTIITPDGLAVLSDSRFHWLDSKRKGHFVFINKYKECKASNQHLFDSIYIQCMKENGYQPISCEDAVKYYRQLIKSGLVKSQYPLELIDEIFLANCSNDHL